MLEKKDKEHKRVERIKGSDLNDNKASKMMRKGERETKRMV